MKTKTFEILFCEYKFRFVNTEFAALKLHQKSDEDYLFLTIKIKIHVFTHFWYTKLLY